MSFITHSIAVSDIASEMATEGSLLAEFINDCAMDCAGLATDWREIAEFVDSLDKDGRAFLRWLAAQVPEVEAP